MSQSLTEDEWNDITEEMYEWMYDCIQHYLIEYANSDFREEIFEQCKTYFTTIGNTQEWYQDEDEYLIDEMMNVIYCTITEDILCLPRRQRFYPTSTPIDTEYIRETLEKVNTYPVQIQRSPEWYDIRKKCFSASNLWKLFGSSSQYNSLIYEKCKPMDPRMDRFGGGMSQGPSNMNNPLNWGIKYEPLSVMIYEHKNHTTVNTNYGCIPHQTLPIGASPDGIVNDSNSSKYGRMLEIKNIYNREITGIPSEEYWIQMQIQMETTKLPYCDFLETRFKEYESKDAFLNDDMPEHEYKGIILYFIPLDHSVHKNMVSKFVYMPLHIKDYDSWIESQMVVMEDTHILYETIYWYMDEYSCVLVERNQVWFQSTIAKIQEAWNIVEKEKVEGYEHRAPQRRPLKLEESMVSQRDLQNVSKQNDTLSHDVKHIKVIPNAVCLIKLDEDGNVVTAK